MSNYEPGTVAVATVRGVPNVRVMRTDENGTPFAWCAADPCDDAVWATASEVTDVRPLVVLDLADNPLGDSELTRAELLSSLRGEMTITGAWLADQIEAQIRPPKPAEPGKYGAVIAGDGREWFRYTTSEMHGRDWCRPGSKGKTEYATWDDLEVIRVTNPGVDQ